MDWKRKCMTSQSLYTSYEPMKITLYTSVLWVASTAHAAMKCTRSNIVLPIILRLAWGVSSKW